jgi:hypothetical protein
VNEKEIRPPLGAFSFVHVLSYVSAEVLPDIKLAAQIRLSRIGNLCQDFKHEGAEDDRRTRLDATLFNLNSEIERSMCSVS